MNTLTLMATSMALSLAGQLPTLQLEIPLPGTPRSPPAAWVAFMEKVWEAEALHPPGLERCLAMPALPDNTWAEGVWEAVCRNQYVDESLHSLEAITAMVTAGDWAGLDALFHDYLEEHYTAGGRRGLLHRLFERFGTAEGLGTAQAWYDLAPESPFALSALSRAMSRAAQRLRGTAFASDTSPEQFDAMHRMIEAAIPFSVEALDLQPKLVNACLDLMHMGQLASLRPIQIAALNACLEADPTLLTTYRYWLSAVQPKWGGSLEAMDEVKAFAAQHAEANPLLHTVLLSAEGDLLSGLRPHRSDDLGEHARALLRSEVLMAPDVDRMQTLGGAAVIQRERWQALAYLSLRLSMHPDDAYSLYMRGRAYYFLQDPTRAMTDLARSLEVGYRLPWINYVLGWIANHEIKDPDLVVKYLTPIIDDAQYGKEAIQMLAFAELELREDGTAALVWTEKLIERYPEDAISWGKHLYALYDAFRMREATELTETILSREATDAHWESLHADVRRIRRYVGLDGEGEDADQDDPIDP